MASPVKKFVWYDVMTTDTKASETFYKHVIGWEARREASRTANPDTCTRPDSASSPFVP